MLQAVRQVAVAMSLVHPHVLATYAYELRPMHQLPPGARSIASCSSPGGAQGSGQLSGTQPSAAGSAQHSTRQSLAGSHSTGTGAG